jgi:hypothetical protein
VPAAITKPTKTWAPAGSPLHELVLADILVGITTPSLPHTRAAAMLKDKHLTDLVTEVWKVDRKLR